MSNRSVGFIVVNAIDLGETMHDKTSFILIDLAHSVLKTHLLSTMLIPFGRQGMMSHM